MPDFSSNVVALLGLFCSVLGTSIYHVTEWPSHG